MTRKRDRASLFTSAILLALLPALAVPSAAEEVNSHESYGYVRSLEGSAGVVAKAGDRSDLEVNQTILVGDRIHVANLGKVEVVLADRNVLRVDGGSEVGFVDLAFSPDGSGGGTLLEVPEGNVLLTVAADSLGRERPRIDTPNATVYVHQAGVYRLTAIGDDWTQLVVRQGFAEVVTRNGSASVRPGEQATVEGRDRPGIDLAAADLRDGLERWARELDDRAAAVRDDGYVDRRLARDAAPLYQHGAWVTIGGRAVWRPLGVESSWRPYSRGRWRYTPSGLTWISYEPWGWLTYHYGCWDLDDRYGWVWYPGSVWSPAWVYWYWGPDWVGWCPIGYYTRWYGGHYGWDVSFSFGIHGWAGGRGWYDNWCFSRPRDIGRHDLDHRVVAGLDLGRRNERLADGVIVSDTRGLEPGTWNQPEQVLQAIRDKPGAASLPDVTGFVSRQPISIDDRTGMVIRGGSGDRPTLAKPVLRAPDAPARRDGGYVDSGNLSKPAPSGVDRGRPTIYPEEGGGRQPGGNNNNDWRRKDPPTLSKPAPSGGDHGRPTIYPEEGGDRRSGGRVIISPPADSGDQSQPASPPRELSKPPARDTGKPSSPPSDSRKPAPREISKPAPAEPASPPPARDNASLSRDDWRRPRGHEAQPSPLAADRGASEVRREVVVSDRDNRGGTESGRSLGDESWRARSTDGRTPTIHVGRTASEPSAPGGRQPYDGGRAYTPRRDDDPPVVRRVIEGVRTPSVSRGPSGYSAPPSAGSSPSSGGYGKPMPYPTPSRPTYSPAPSVSRSPAGVVSAPPSSSPAPSSPPPSSGDSGRAPSGDGDHGNLSKEGGGHRERH
jgi:hypothetical protein